MNEPDEVTKHPRQVLMNEMAKRGWTRDELVNAAIKSNPGLVQGKFRMMFELYWQLGSNNPTYKMGRALAAPLSVALGYHDGFLGVIEHQWHNDASSANDGLEETHSRSDGVT